jgi:hypothetical protein
MVQHELGAPIKYRYKNSLIFGKLLTIGWAAISGEPFDFEAALNVEYHREY